jgi:TatD DNase family protein
MGSVLNIQQPLFDTHVHLCDPRFEADLGDVLARARESGVATVMEIGDSPRDWDKVLALAAANPGLVHAALGYHPHFAHEWTPAVEEALRGKGGFAALGEVGLDYVKSEAPRETQLRVFRWALETAVGLGKPVVLHCREAFDDLFSVLSDFAPALSKAGAPGVVHCFSGGPAEAERAAAMGFLLGVDGPVTYPKNAPLREALRAAGLDRLVLETDSPWLPPQSARGRRNEPALLAEVAAALAALLSVPLAEVAARTTANGRRLFRL